MSFLANSKDRGHQANLSFCKLIKRKNRKPDEVYYKQCASITEMNQLPGSTLIC